MTELTPNPDRRSAVSSSFRRQLGVELGWLSEHNIIPPPLAAELGRTYGVEEVGAEGSQKLAWVIFLVGVLLIGCGVVALVAWHWEDMSQTVQLLLIVSAMLTAHVSGYLLWFHGNRPRLGHALVLLGTLLFLANIGLIAQIFHIPSDGRSSWLALAAGAAAVALALNSVPNFLLVQVGILSWSLHDVGGASSYNAWFAPLLLVDALLTARIVLRTGSSLALRAGWIAATILAGQTVNYIVPGIREESLFLLVTLASGAIAAGLAAYSGPTGNTPDIERRRDLSATLQTLAAVFIAASAFLGGFLEFHRKFTSSDLVAWSVWGFALILVGISVAIAFRYALVTRRDSSAFANVATSAPLGLALAALVAAVGSPAPIPAAFASNLAVLITGSVLATTGVREERRGRFWFGTALILATVLARFFEYETNLWLKAAAFIASGVLVLAIGLAFERRIRRHRDLARPQPSPPSSPTPGIPS